MSELTESELLAAKYKRHLESVIQANKKYRAANPELIRTRRREKYLRDKERPDFAEKQQAKNRRRLMRKTLKIISEDIDKLLDITDLEKLEKETELEVVEIGI
jgi:phage terminase large subunit-like protein